MPCSIVYHTNSRLRPDLAELRPHFWDALGTDADFRLATPNLGQESGKGYRVTFYSNLEGPVLPALASSITIDNTTRWLYRQWHLTFNQGSFHLKVRHLLAHRAILERKVNNEGATAVELIYHDHDQRLPIGPQKPANIAHLSAFISLGEASFVLAKPRGRLLFAIGEAEAEGRTARWWWYLANKPRKGRSWNSIK